MSIRKFGSEDYTSTGVQTAIEGLAGADVTLGIDMSAATGGDVDIEVQVVPDGAFYKLETGITDSVVRTSVGPISAIRLDVDALTSGTVTLEYSAAEKR